MHALATYWNTLNELSCFTEQISRTFRESSQSEPSRSVHEALHEASGSVHEGS